MDVVLWIAVGICLFVLITAGVAVLVAALVGVKAVKAMRSQLESSLTELNAGTTELEQRMEAVASRSDELQRSLDSLTESLRKVTVLVNATRDVRDVASHIGDLVPKK